MAAELSEILKKVLFKIQVDVKNYLESGRHLIGHQILVPIQSHNGFFSSADNKRSTIFWVETLRNIYGGCFDNLKELDDLIPLLKYRNSLGDSEPESSRFYNLRLIESILEDLLTGEDWQIKICSDKRRLGQRINNVCKLIEVDTIECQLVIPLEGIEFNSPIEFQNISIKNMSWELRVDYFEQCAIQTHGLSHGLRGFDEFSILTNGHSILTYSYQTPKDQTNHTPLQQCENIIDILRLYCPALIRPLFFSIEEKRIAIKRRLSGMITSPSISSPFPADAFVVQHSKHLSFFLQKHISSTPVSSGPYRFVVERLKDQSLKDSSQEHRVFNYISIIESLLVGTDSGEFKFKLSILGAGLLGKSPEEKMEIYNLLRKGYDLRSKYAHCVKIQPKYLFSSEEINYLATLTHEIIRQAMSIGDVDTLHQKALELLLN